MFTAVFTKEKKVELLPSYLNAFFFILSFQDVYFDDESAEVVISSLRLGDDQDR
jgi:hypothetical protein